MTSEEETDGEDEKEQLVELTQKPAAAPTAKSAPASSPVKKDEPADEEPEEKEPADEEKETAPVAAPTKDEKSVSAFSEESAGSVVSSHYGMTITFTGMIIAAVVVLA